MSRWKWTPVEHPGRPSPGAVRWIDRFVRPWMRLAHRPSLHGTEHLPIGRPYMLVANHSGGVAMAELLSFASLYLEKVGAERPLAGFAHPLAFRIWPASSIVGGLGAVPSTYDSARDTLARGVPLLIFPGGDHDSLRPIWRAFDVDFTGRKGFLRIAREMQVPVVPMGIRGSHFTVPILWRSRWLLPIGLVLPRALGIKRWCLTALGVAGAVWMLLGPGADWSLPAQIAATMAWLTSPFIFLPIVPWTVTMRIGPPMEPAELFTGTDAEALDRVERAIERLVRTRA